MPKRELTGRTVLFALIGFFAVVGGVNAVMVYAATSTFGGVEVASSYKAGLKFKDELAAVRAQDALHWQVEARLDRRADGDAEVSVSLRDAKGAPVSAVEVAARLAHPADARRDHEIDMRAAGPGLFKGTSDAALAAQWDLVLDVTRDGESVFRSKSRVGLK
jgi:nitrogen fixation protein FixH